MSNKEIEILNKNLDILIEVAGGVDAQVKKLGELAPTRCASIVKTKLEEAVMWLEKGQADLSIMLARATCR